MIAGRVSINYTDYETKPFDEFYSVFLREVIHALGLHSQAYPYWKEPGTDKKYPDGVPYKTKWDGLTYLNTPTVAYLMKEYFGISDEQYENLYGFPMENHGCEGEPGFMWKQKFAPQDINTSGTLESGDKVVSIFTLAALMDTGWYKTYPTDDMAKTMISWGKGRGIAFFNLPCMI
jgi:hypothetical protein